MKTVLLTFFLNAMLFLTAFSQEQCLTNAWNNYNVKQWRRAITEATDCTTQRGPGARQMQKKLVAKAYKLPANYTVPGSLTPEQKNEIFSHGLLNDVAVSYWIVGMSNLHINNKQGAKQAFQQAVKLSFGLCYDPKKNLFWSPVEESQLQLDELK
jgi:hypothetical protein